MILSLVVLLGISGCQSGDAAEIIEVPEYPSDVIDWSIYSWQEDGEWVFSIVDRYAGYTTFEEISADEFRLDGVEVLVEALLHLPDNSEILWTEYAIAGTVLCHQPGRGSGNGLRNDRIRRKRFGGAADRVGQGALPIVS